MLPVDFGIREATLGHTAEDSIRSDLEAILSATGLFTTCQTCFWCCFRYLLVFVWVLPIF